MEYSKEIIRKWRLLKSGIVHPFDSTEECLRRLFGIQAQAQQFGEISLLNRVRDLTRDKLQEEYRSHRIIKLWGQRTTVHMYRREDWKTLFEVYAHRNNFVRRGWAGHEDRLEQVLAALERSTARGPASKVILEELIEKTVPDVEHPYRNYSIFIHAVMNGRIFGYPDPQGIKRYYHRNACISGDEYDRWGSERESSMDYLLVNYFTHYGPATLADFCHWSGLRRSEVTESLRRIGPQLQEIGCEGKTVYRLANDPIGDLSDTTDADNCHKLLGKFDPLFLSFADKSWIVTPQQQKAIWRPSAHVEAVALAGGKAAGTWRYKIKGNTMDFELYRFGKIPVKSRKRLQKEAEKIAAFQQKKVGRVQFD